jgi:hypothetical protein
MHSGPPEISLQLWEHPEIHEALIFSFMASLCFLSVCCLLSAAQDDLQFLRSQDPTAGALTPDIDAMLALLKAPRTYTAAAAAAGTAAPVLSPAVSLSALSAATAASKLLLPAGPSYELTATAAAAPATTTEDLAGPQPPAATASCAGQLHSYPCEVHTDVHTSSSIHSHSSSSTDPQVHALRGPAHSIMQDGQFGCAGDAPMSRCNLDTFWDFAV